MRFLKSGKPIPGRLCEIQATRSDGMACFIEKAAQALKLDFKPEEISLYTYSGITIMPDSQWTLGRYSSLKKKSLCVLKFGIGPTDPTQCEVHV